MSYKLSRLGGGLVMVVGCGGTGGFVAEGLCRLLPKKFNIALVDPDTVEARNLDRQNFYDEDLGRFKAQSLAERLSRNFNREIFYDVRPIEQMSVEDRGDLTIGCVDNGPAREKLQYAGYHMGGRFSYCKRGGWYIDAGNSENSGQVLIGNALLKELQHSFCGEVCSKLPLPQVQQPALLITQVRPQRNCADAGDEQSPVINRMMADLLLTFVHKLLTGTLTWMGVYIDLESGAMSPVDAEPATVSRITGLTVRQLEYRPRPIKERVRVTV